MDIDPSEIKKILVTKLRHHGDVLLSSPVFSVLKAYYPEAKIDAYVYEETSPMLSGHPSIEDILVYNRQIKRKSRLQGLFHEFKLLKKIYLKHYDLVINLTEGDRGALAALVSLAKYKVGIDPEGSGFLGKGKLYTHIVKICRSPRHTVERNLDALRCIGIHPKPQERELYFHILKEDEKHVEHMLSDYGLKKMSYVLLHPVSRWLFKCWPEKSFAELIKRLISRGEKVVMTASKDPEEMKMNERILSLVGSDAVVNLSGETTLKQLGALIKFAKVLICVDSLPLHLASVFKTPVLVLFGPTSDITWSPWRHPFSEVVTESMSCRPCFMPGCGGSKKSDCLEQLSVDKVDAALKRLLERLLSIQDFNVFVERSRLCNTFHT